jgi:hypothetical protein
MELTWGFLVLMIFFVLPGFIIRRLYFHQDFSKLYRYNENLLKTIFYSLIPGIINVLVVYILFDKLFQEIDLIKVIEAYKNLSNPTATNSNIQGEDLKNALFSGILPFLCALITSAIITGILAGRIVRIFGLDIRWQILRFKNPWFYLFHGQQAKFRNFKFLHPKTSDPATRNSKFLFTNVDALVETSDGNKLYSGILIDYELQAENNQELSKLILRNAERYAKDTNGKTNSKYIPGSLFIVDCSKLINLNLFYVYGESRDFIKTRTPRYIYLTFAIFTVLLIPFLFFKVPWINFNWYNRYFEMSIVGMIFFGSWFLQVFQLLNPFSALNEKGQITWEGKNYLWKLFAAIGAFFVAGLVEWIAQCVLSLF